MKIKKKQWDKIMKYLKNKPNIDIIKEYYDRNYMVCLDTFDHVLVVEKIRVFDKKKDWIDAKEMTKAEVNKAEEEIADFFLDPENSKWYNYRIYYNRFDMLNTKNKTKDESELGLVRHHVNALRQSISEGE